MKQILETVKYLVAAIALFMLFYFSYLIAVSLGFFMLPIFFLLAAAVVMAAKFSHDRQEQE